MAKNYIKMKAFEKMIISLTKLHTACTNSGIGENMTDPLWHILSHYNFLTRYYNIIARCYNISHEFLSQIPFFQQKTIAAHLNQFNFEYTNTHAMAHTHTHMLIITTQPHITHTQAIHTPIAHTNSKTIHTFHRMYVRNVY